jgi:transcriptional regulator of acetoin/glycerol metabolism
MDRLLAYAWPGNARELKSAFEFAFVSCPGGMIGSDHLPPQIVDTGRACDPAPALFEQSIDEVKRRRLEDALTRSGGNQSEAARLLGISRTSVWKQIKKYNLRR